MAADRLGDGLFDGEALFRGIPTRWSVLKGPPREALDYLARTYGRAIMNYLRGRLARGEYSPLTPADADDLFQDFFVRLGTTDWLRKPDPSRGPFRQFFVQRLKYFLREKRSAAIARRGRPHECAFGDAPEPEAPDVLGEALEKEWRVATIRETLQRIKRHRPAAWHDVLAACLEREDQPHADLARGLGMTLDSFESVLKRARKVFRELMPLVDGRLDGFGGEDF